MKQRLHRLRERSQYQNPAITELRIPPPEARSPGPRVECLFPSPPPREIEITRRDGRMGGGGFRHRPVNHNSRSLIQFRPLACIYAAWNRRSSSVISPSGVEGRGRIVLVKSPEFHVYSIRRDARRGALSRACPDKMGKAIFSRYGDPPRITRGYCSADVARPGTDAILINTKGILRNIGGIVESLFFSDFR